MTKHSQRHGNCGKFVHVNLNVDSNTHYDTLEDICSRSGLEFRDKCEFGSLEQHGKDYIRPYADLESRTPIRRRKQLKHMYQEWLDGISKFNILDTIQRV